MNTKITGIYRIVSPIGHVYIGASRNINQRFNQHRNKSITKHRILRNSLDTYGRVNHKYEVIHELPLDISTETLLDYESLFIEQYNNCGISLLNSNSGGNSPKWFPESIDYMKGRNGIHMTGRKISAESIAKRTAKTKGMKRSEETRKRISDSKKGDKNPMYGKHTNNKHPKL